MTDPEITALAERLEEKTLPVCPYDKRSPDYWTTNDDAPCVVCGQLNDFSAPVRCRGADTRVMDEAATALRALVTEREAMRRALEFYANPETYHACGFLFDSPTGGFDEDFEVDHGHEDYPRAMPGKTARKALSALAPKEPNNGD